MRNITAFGKYSDLYQAQFFWRCDHHCQKWEKTSLVFTMFENEFTKICIRSNLLDDVISVCALFIPVIWHKLISHKTFHNTMEWMLISNPITIFFKVQSSWILKMNNDII